MKAITLNTKRSLVKAVSAAPRNERASWILTVQVGSQTISPLAWAIESGSLQTASAMIGDLLTIRADRESYYYGADELFSRHFDIVNMLIKDAPTLVTELLDGLLWRSRLSQNGVRRTNYFLQHLLVDA